MIDINELRRLAQAARTGPDGVSLSWIRRLRDFQQGASPAAVSELLDRLGAAEKSDAESLAMYRKARGERDALRAALQHESDRVEAAKAVIDALRARIEEMEQPAPIERLRASLEAAEKEGDTMRTKISDLTINVEYLGNLKKSYEELIGELQDDRDALRAEIEELHALIAAVKKQANAEFYLRVKKEEEYARLRAKIEAMEKQAPAYWGPKHAIEGGSTTVIVGKFPVNPTDAPLYALPGAKGEEE